MLPHFNPHLQNPSKDQLQRNGIGVSASQQVMGNPSNFGPNPMQIRPQFPMGVLNPQFAMPQFANPNTYFAPTQLFPFPQGNIQGIGSNVNHIFPHNTINPQQFFPNVQFNLSNLAQNVNQILQMQIQNCVPQNVPTLQPGGMNGNGNLQQSATEDVLKQMNHNATAANDFTATQQQDLHTFPSRAAKSQGNEGEFNRNNNWKRSDKKHFIGNLKGGGPQKGFVKQQFRPNQNSKGNFKCQNENQEKGCKNGGVNFALSDSCKQVQGEKGRKFLLLNYTEQEIQQWRDERRKNYPSKANIEKNLKATSLPSKITDAGARIRRQQLKEILEKQAELGCEVAEIPAFYLSDAEQQTNGQFRNQKGFGKRERFQNKFEKRGKFRQNDQVSVRQAPEDGSTNCSDRKDIFAKKQRLASGSISTENRRDPSLLQKLLRSDIERDKKHLLQVFRFMVMNSFFENLPKKSLEFPVVIVKESGVERASIEERHHVGEVNTSASSICNVSFLGNHGPDVLGKDSSKTVSVTKIVGVMPREEG